MNCNCYLTPYFDPLFPDFIASGGKLKDGGVVSDVTYMFLIKPSATEEQALRNIFSDRGVPLEINYVFDF